MCDVVPRWLYAIAVFSAISLRDITAFGIKEATNWSLRAGAIRTTPLLIWDNNMEEVD
ncbi:hypothetical protein ACJMK2_035419, partial [Sinanodonta woodiana]